MYKHYIRTNIAGEVNDAFSTAFRDPAEGDILVAETEERHFNPSLLAEQGIYRYLWNGKGMMERNPEELTALIKARRDSEAILARLAELDAVITRSLEDLYIATGKTPYETVQTAVDEKVKLREKLREV